MNKQKSSLLGRLEFGLVIACSVFMTGAGLLGFLSWLNEPSNQKWAALFCGLIGAAMTLVLWKSKDDIINKKPTSKRKLDNKP